MRRTIRNLALLALTTLAMAGLSSTSDAQVKRLSIPQGPSYHIPGTGITMYPAPRYGYQIGGTRIYPGRYSNRGWWNWNSSYQSNPWSYGYPSGYTWPYRTSVNSWPYGRSRF